MVEAAQRAETFATVIAPWSQVSFRAPIGHCRPPVINPDTGGVQVWHIRARRWRKRPNQAVLVAPVGRTAAITSKVPTARAPPTRFSTPVTARCPRRISLQRSRRGSSPLDWFQVPHHGSRRNLSSDVLDAWLGPMLPSRLSDPAFDAVVSANQNDPEHPKNAVVRALIHRGRRVFQTKGKLHMRSSGAPHRGWRDAQALDYPRDQEG